MSGPPPPPFSALWQIKGSVGSGVSRWCIDWHLSLFGATDFSYAAQARLHQDLLLLSEHTFPHLMGNESTCDVSRMILTGPSTSQGSEFFLTSQGTRGPVAPVSVAVPVRQLVQAAGKGRAGRFWLPPPAHVDIDFPWQLSPSAASSYSTYLAALFNQVNTYTSAAFPHVRFAVLHRRSSGQWLSAAQIQPVDTWVLSRLLGSQRRRLTGVRVP